MSVMDDITSPRGNGGAGQDRAALGYSKPETYEELRAVLSSGTVRLPKKLRQVAIYLWQHPSEVALGTVTTLARQAGVQPSTMVRFAQTFGYSGFSDFQDVFKTYVQGRLRARRAGGRMGGRILARQRLRAVLDRVAVAGQGSPRHGELR
jgi:DNA-binding MurR/RpiR family transcriptional regulator